MFCIKDLKHSTVYLVFNLLSGYQHIRMYDLNSDNPNPVVNYDGIQKNVTSVGFHEEGKWMYTGGEDNTVRIWDLRLEKKELVEKILHACTHLHTSP